MEHIKNIIEKINNLTLRERVIVFLTVIVVMFFLWDSFLMVPIEQEQKNTIASINKKNVDRMTLVNEVQATMNQNQVDPDADNVNKLKLLRSNLINVQAELESSTTNLVSPTEMPKILETVLHKTGGLTLNNLRSLGVSPLVAKEENENLENTDNKVEQNDDSGLTADNIDNAYKHGLRIEFQGDYLTTLDYLKQLEELEWGFFWDGFELNVNEYPEARTSIEIFTLSLQQEWIGV